MAGQKATKLNHLFHLDSELDEIIYDFAYLADRFKDFHPANNGDISQVLSEKLGTKLKKRFVQSATDWYEISKIQRLAEIRNDGRTGYRSEGVTDKDYFKLLKPMAGRVSLVTCTGSDVPSLQFTLDQHEEGKLLNLVEVDSSATKIRLLYGNKEYGTIPSIETHIHLVANAMSITDGINNPSTVHVHPYHMILLGRDKRIRGSKAKFNSVLYSQNGVVKNMHPHLVGITPYSLSGSAKLVIESIPELQKHKMVLWMNHGVTVRSETIRKGYILISYLDDAARYALDELRGDSLGISEESILKFLKEKSLITAYKSMLKLSYAKK